MEEANPLAQPITGLVMGVTKSYNRRVKTVVLAEFLDRIRERKAALGIEDTPAATEAMRNKGGQRTVSKRQLLAQAEERAAAAGRSPIKSYF
jgi:hypothetical protein